MLCDLPKWGDEMGILDDIMHDCVAARIPRTVRLSVLRYAETIPQGGQRVLYMRAASGRSKQAAVKAMCQHCVGYEDVRHQVSNCPHTACALWTHRPYQARSTAYRAAETEAVRGTLPDTSMVPYRSVRAAQRARQSRSAAIRVHCLTCMGGDYRLVRECASRTCPLWLYRPGAKAAEGNGAA